MIKDKIITNLPVAFILFLSLAAVRVVLGATRITLILTLLGGILLLGSSIVVIVVIPASVPTPLSVLLIHLLGEEARVRRNSLFGSLVRRLVGEGHVQVRLTALES